MSDEEKNQVMDQEPEIVISAAAPPSAPAQPVPEVQPLPEKLISQAHVILAAGVKCEEYPQAIAYLNRTLALIDSRRKWEARQLQLKELEKQGTKS